MSSCIQIAATHSAAQKKGATPEIGEAEIGRRQCLRKFAQDLLPSNERREFASLINAFGGSLVNAIRLSKDSIERAPNFAPKKQQAADY